MPHTLYKELAEKLREAGFEIVRRGKGSHTVFNKKGLKRPIVVGWNIHDHGLAARILKAAGLSRLGM